MIQYTHILLCPTTQQQLSRDEWGCSSGVCPRCGHVASGTFTHSEKVVGWWEEPTLLKRMLGFRAKFHRKPDPEV